ncbi:hypothetical protein HDU93_007384, partial [Gonapodya sp. JEL0774]
MPPKIQRYRAGQLPKGVTEKDLYSSDSENEDDKRERQEYRDISSRPSPAEPVLPPQPVSKGVDAATDRRLRRVEEARSGLGRGPGQVQQLDLDDRDEELDERPGRERFAEQRAD